MRTDVFIPGRALVGIHNQIQIAGAADWWLRETSDKIIQPLLAEFPDPDHAGVAERMVRIQASQSEIEEMRRHAFVLPVSMVAPDGGV